VIKAIIFDFFDTIAADFYRVWLERNRFARTGEFLEIAQEIDAGSIELEEYYARLSKLSAIPANAIRQEFETETQLNYGMLELIDQLRENYRIALVTNSPQGLVRKILRSNDLEKYFDEVVISGEVGFVKPDPEVFRIALKKLDVDPAEAIFIDDLESYLEGAKEAGITGILFKEVGRLRRDLKKAGIKIVNLEDPTPG